MTNRVGRWEMVSALLAVTSCVFGCGGASSNSSPGPAKESVTCPAGQVFDGAYCVGASTTPASSSSTAVASPANSASEMPPAAASASVAPQEEVPPATTSTSTATPLDTSLAGGVAPLIQYLAAAHIPQGAKPLGLPFAAQFQQGQRYEQKVGLTAGKCYTFVAAAAPPMASIALIVTASDGTKLLEETDGGTQVALGRKKACFVASEVTKEVTVVIVAEKGNGVAGAQVFEK